jgi:glycosyltransferase involved in cell wall biosynthesis
LQKCERKILAVLPSVYGFTGDVVNEMSLLSFVCKKNVFCYLFTILSPFQVVKYRKSKFRVHENMRVFTFITPPRPNPLLNLILRLFFSYVFVSLILVSGLSRKLSLIYVRDSTFAPAFLSLKSLADKTIVKIPSILEAEISCKGLAKRLADRIIEFADRLAFAKAKKIAVHSIPQAIELARRRRSIPRGGFIEVPPGFSPDVIDKIKTKATLQTSNNINFKVGYVGTLSPHQGVDLLAEAISLVTEKSPHIELIIIGDGLLKRNLLKFCREKGIKCEATGFIPHKEALAKMLSLDVLVAPRRRTAITETIIPIKVVEAWALGIPVIVTCHKAFKIRYHDLEDVVYCEPKPEDIADKIILLLQNKDLRNRLQRRGPELAREYSYDTTAEKLLNC